MTTATRTAIALRLATPADAATIGRLAQLDSAHVPAGDVLLAEVDGTARAAVSLTTGAAIADPFAATSDLVALLRARAVALRVGRARRRMPALRPRLRAA
jgi:hypothetical protein